jgi:hypothetical protein
MSIGRQGLRLAALADLSKGMGAEEMNKIIGSAFFLRQTRATAVAPAAEMTAIELLTGEGDEAIDERITDYSIYAVRSAGSKPFGGEYISLGRGEGNDILIDDPSISKFHAFIVQQGNDFALADAGSKHGTFLNEEKVANYRESKPRPLKEGDRVRVAEVRLTFVHAPAVLELCKRALAVK